MWVDNALGSNWSFFLRVNAWSPEVELVCSFLYPYASPSREYKGAGERQRALRGQVFPQIAGGVTNTGPIPAGSRAPSAPFDCHLNRGSSPCPPAKPRSPSTWNTEMLSPSWACRKAACSSWDGRTLAGFVCWVSSPPHADPWLWGIFWKSCVPYQPFGKVWTCWRVVTEWHMSRGDYSCGGMWHWCCGMQLVPAWHCTAPPLFVGLRLWIFDFSMSVWIHRS